MADTDPIWRRILALPADSQAKTIAMAVLVSAVSALVVSVAAVTLQPRIDANFEAERQAKLDEMIAALPGLGAILAETGADSLETVVVDLAEARVAGDFEGDASDLAALGADPATSTELSDDQDIAGIRRRPDVAQLYVLRSGGDLALVILPVYAAGYQSTIKAYLALEGDLSTVAGLVVTAQAETPGLGAKIAEPAWQALWPGKQIFDAEGALAFQVVRGKATTDYQLDGITGATRTSNAVEGMIRFWMGPQGYGAVLDALAAGEIEMTPLRTLTAPLIENNPVTLQILGICSALAVTTSMTTALTMSCALTAVLMAGSALISLIRRHIPTAIRLILQITIIASLVIVTDLILQAYAFEISKRLSIFVALIVTNCLVLGRAEAFAMQNPVGPSVLDAIGNGLGYSLILMTVGFVRELLGRGTLFGWTVLPGVDEGGWFEPLGVMLLAPSAFIVLGLVIWAIRARRVEQVEPDEFPLAEPEAGQ